MIPFSPPTCQCCGNGYDESIPMLESTRWEGLVFCEPCLEEFFDAVESLNGLDHPTVLLALEDYSEYVAGRVRICGLDWRHAPDLVEHDNPLVASLLDYDSVTYASGFYFNTRSPSGDKATRLIKRDQSKFPSGDMRRIQPPKCSCCGNTHDRAALYEYDEFPGLVVCAECQVVLAQYLDSLQILSNHPFGKVICGDSIWVPNGVNCFTELRIKNKFSSDP